MHRWVIAISIVTLVLPDSTVAQSTPARSFYDNFSSLDRRSWLVSNGWSNGPHQNCTWSSANVRRSSTALALTLSHRRGVDRPYSCAELQTKNFYRFGTFEARLQPAAGPGLVSSFFIYSHGSSGGTSDVQQISFDFPGKDRNTAILTHSARGLPLQRVTIALEFAASETPADYAFQWTPTLLRWYVNRRIVHEVKQRDGISFPDRPARLYLSIRNGTGDNEERWLGRFEPAHQPFTTSILHAAFTELGAPCQFPSSVVCEETR